MAFARSKVPRWSVILDRPRSAIFGDARRKLVIELGLIAGAALFGLALLAWILARARAETNVAGRAGTPQAVALRAGAHGRHHPAAQPAVGVPPIASIDSAARYQAGSTGLEVGGDWYDVWSGPTGSCTSRSATSPGAASRRLR